MREDEMLKVAVSCASDVARGIDVEPTLADTTRILLRADAGAAVVAFPVIRRTVAATRIIVSGSQEFPIATLPAALAAVDSHPTLRSLMNGRSSPVRLSDAVDVHAF